MGKWHHRGRHLPSSEKNACIVPGKTDEVFHSSSTLHVSAEAMPQTLFCGVPHEPGYALERPPWGTRPAHGPDRGIHHSYLPPRAMGRPTVPLSVSSRVSQGFAMARRVLSGISDRERNGIRRGRLPGEAWSDCSGDYQSPLFLGMWRLITAATNWAPSHAEGVWNRRAAARARCGKRCAIPVCAAPAMGREAVTS